MRPSTDETNAAPHERGIERAGFAALTVGLLSPVIAQGLWRPLEHLLGPGGTARQITAAALVIATSAAVATRLSEGSRRAVLVTGGLTVALCTWLSLGLAGLGALLPVAATSVWLSRWLPPRLPPAFDGLARHHRLLALLYLLTACVCVAWTARVSVFIGDPTAVEDQALPGEAFVETHSCLSAYVRASELVRQGVDNVYDDPWWYGSNGLPALPPGVENPYRPFQLDNFSYPPPFLLLATALAPLDGDFFAQRGLWFGINGVLAAVGLWTVARWVDGPAAHRVLLLAPLLLGSVPFLVTLQIGNFHLAATVLSLLAMVAFDRRRPVAGAALLAITILSKISPGILGLGLLLQRRVREAALVAGAGALLLAASALAFGTRPLLSFVTFALPRLRSGAAFPFIDTPVGIATNMSMFGFPFKLAFLGFDVREPWRLGPQISLAYTLGLLPLAVVAARRSGDRRDQALRWMGLLVLAALQSPFCPAYCTLGLLWATALLSVEVRRPSYAVALVVLWPAVLFVPQGLALPAQAILSMAHTILTIGVCVWLVIRAPRTLGEPGPALPPIPPPAP